MLLSVAFKAFEALNKVLLLVVRQSLDDVDHKDAIATVAEPLAQVEALVLRVVHDLWLTSAVDGVVEKDAFLEKHVHLVVFGVVADIAARFLEDVEVEHLAEVCHVDLMDLDRILRFFLWQ